MKIFKNKIEKTLDYLEEIGAKNSKHIRNNTLFSHLKRVQEILDSWNLNEITQMVGLCHSLYSTEYFKYNLLDVKDRSILRNKIGEDEERVVYYFSILNRENITFLANENIYEIENFHTKEKLQISKYDGDILVHIMLANDIDHLSIQNVEKSKSIYHKYDKLSINLCSKAKSELDKLISFKDAKKSETRVRFIAHAGVSIFDKSSSLAIDPWLYDSHIFGSPIIESLDPAQKTIDYLIPQPKTSAIDISPDIICLSHFHTHHSPLREILEFAKIKPITVICPVLSAEKLIILKEKIGDYIYSRITFIFLEKDTEFKVKNFAIKAFMHKDNMPHFMYNITLGDVSIMHIVDANANKDVSKKDFDESWSRVYNLNPDYLFMGCISHISKSIKNGIRSLEEMATLSPVQAANLAVLVKARNIIPIGMYNHSVWDDRYEMGLSVADAEAQFYFAISFLAPAINFKKCYPGDFLN